MTVGDLAERVETSWSTAFAKAGFVTRERAEMGDRRVATVSLTDDGRARHIERQTHLELSLNEALTDMDATQGAIGDSGSSSPRRPLRHPLRAPTARSRAICEQCSSG
jgi:DNA-binding MarR family transcriptional regulator